MISMYVYTQRHHFSMIVLHMWVFYFYFFSFTMPALTLVSHMLPCIYAYCLNHKCFCVRTCTLLPINLILTICTFLCISYSWVKLLLFALIFPLVWFVTHHRVFIVFLLYSNTTLSNAYDAKFKSRCTGRWKLQIEQQLHQVSVYFCFYRTLSED